MKKIVYFISIGILLAITNSCIEEFDAATEEFEDALVVEATITNELKYHEILLSRTYKFEDYEPNLEPGAVIKIETSNNETYSFRESGLGVYTSTQMFKAEPNVEYTLSINTKDGNEYVSQSTQLTNVTSIDNVYASKTIDEDGVEGVGLYVDSYDPSNNSKYYGYAFEETYKVVVPYWSPDDLILNSSGGFSVVPRSQEEQTCYNTIASKGRMLVNTNLLEEDRISEFLLKFIPSDNIRLNTRYSILVKQYTQSRESYNYLKVLDEFSSSQSLLSQIQPGFLSSNIYEVNNSNEKVLGFFEVSSISEKRIFFNREDVLDSFYAWPCTIIDPPANELTTMVRLDRVTLVYEKPMGEDGGPYDVVARICGDCTMSGSNIKPDFWED
ncbi:hypothetical protein BW723_11220 [Polaribacter reichenbachii]|uniref:DUF4249 domain-containing protein n=1 Tax=Polaribacter reichenbachii TaxID=996801 RepID=A0A1B8TQ42_9FLAO|nr:DUF4249 domain-containing protein [Polaribacter reichenbachii]APZ46818.1 hypothetical protein BW723_11220 [Polaribacter reichenbachii]AUC17461.1 hypothetical protein BTO17_01665 [Polaribacter reichenbachii]OBY61664.1 hypothetical protein LPB301_16545 [Polaribacter reichenbachii]